MGRLVGDPLFPRHHSLGGPSHGAFQQASLVDDRRQDHHVPGRAPHSEEVGKKTALFRPAFFVPPARRRTFSHACLLFKGSIAPAVGTRREFASGPQSSGIKVPVRIAKEGHRILQVRLSLYRPCFRKP
jgi:hypothetical protein